MDHVDVWSLPHEEDEINNVEGQGNDHLGPEKALAIGVVATGHGSQGSTSSELPEVDEELELDTLLLEGGYDRVKC